MSNEHAESMFIGFTTKCNDILYMYMIDRHRYRDTPIRRKPVYKYNFADLMFSLIFCSWEREKWGKFAWISLAGGRQNVRFQRKKKKRQQKMKAKWQIG